MARMSIDDKFLRDPRVTRLAKACGWSVRETRGCLLDVFAICYDRIDDVLIDTDIDTAADRDGFGALMVAADLADSLRGGRKFRIKGAHDGVKYLADRQDAGRVGGRKSGESRRGNRSSASKQTKQGFAEIEAPANPLALVPDLALALVPDLALALVPDLALAQEREIAPLAPSPAPRAVSRPRRKPASDLTDAERVSCGVILGKLAERSGTAFRGCDEHLRLISTQLRKGVTEDDLRKIIAYAAEAKEAGGLGWQGDPEWSWCLRPETLFGPKTIAKYLDPAIGWASKAYPTEGPSKRRDAPTGLSLEILPGGMR